jgi:hypothetical protein
MIQTVKERAKHAFDPNFTIIQKEKKKKKIRILVKYLIPRRQPTFVKNETTRAYNNTDS